MNDKVLKVLQILEDRIREQSKSAPMGSMEWRAHMVDLIHLNETREDCKAGEFDA